MQLIYSFTVALFLTIALIPLLIRFSGRLQLLDDPGEERKVHTQLTPRSGGLAIVLGIFIPLAFLLPIEKGLIGLFWGGAAIVTVGYLDDRYQLHYKWKFLGQIVAVIAVMSSGIIISKVPLLGLETAPLWVSLPLTFFFLLGATNAVNLSDGLDGLAAGTSLFSLALIAVLSLLQGNAVIALMAMTVVGGLLGFLRYNTFPARIFMGDTGSQFLGYIVACLALMVSQGEIHVVSPVLPLLILGLPILDTITVMVIRIREKRSPFSPDKNHLHHQIMGLGLKHFEAVAVIYLLQVVLMVSAYLLRFESDLTLLAFCLVFAVSVIGIINLGSQQKNRRSSVSASIDPREQRNHLLRRLTWVHKYSAITVECLIGLILLSLALLVAGPGGGIVSSLTSVAMYIVPGLVLLLFFARKKPVITARIFCYSASISVVYLFDTAALNEQLIVYVNGLFIGVALFLMLAIRTSRKEDFRLDTQDLMVLLFVIIVPLLPFDSLNNHEVRTISLRLAVLIYSCEFILARSKSRHSLLVCASMMSLLLVASTGFFY